MVLKKCIYSTYSPWALQTYDFIALTSLPSQEKFFWLCCKPPVGEIGKAKDLSAPLPTSDYFRKGACLDTEKRRELEYSYIALLMH
jgi:hypothetical protein